MPERTTCNETVRAGVPLRVGTVTLLPIERVVVHSDQDSPGVWISAAKEPYALIVRDTGGLRAIDIGVATVSLQQLRGEIPGLDAVLASL